MSSRPLILVLLIGGALVLLSQGGRAQVPVRPTPTRQPRPKPLLPSFFPLLRPLSPEPGYSIGIDLTTLPLLPDPQLVASVEARFNGQVALLNAQIAEKQNRLYEMLQSWKNDDQAIRAIQIQISQLRTERDRLALEHLLVVRQLDPNFVVPIPRPNPPWPSGSR